MAATTTKTIVCPAHVWTLLADGASVASCSVQTEGAIEIAVASSAPAATSLDCVALGWWPMLTLALAPTDKVYGRTRSFGPDSVHLIQTATT